MLTTRRVITLLSVVGPTFMTVLRASPASSQSVVCFDVSLGPWSEVEGTGLSPERRGPPPADDGTYGKSYVYAVPARIALSPDSARGGLLITIPSGSQETPHRFRLWTRWGDSLILSFSTGFSGTRASLSRRGTGWEGELHTFIDVMGSLRFQRPIALADVFCDAPPVVPASDDPPLPRAVALTSGETIELGASLPAGLVTAVRPSGAVTVMATTTGLFEGTDVITVRLNEQGIASNIQLVYPVDYDLDGLLGRLADRFGPSDPITVASGSWWRNRTTIVYVVASQRSVSLVDPRLRE